MLGVLDFQGDFFSHKFHHKKVKIVQTFCELYIWIKHLELCHGTVLGGIFGRWNKSGQCDSKIDRSNSCYKEYDKNIHFFHWELQQVIEKI